MASYTKGKMKLDDCSGNNLELIIGFLMWHFNFQVVVKCYVVKIVQRNNSNGWEKGEDGKDDMTSSDLPDWQLMEQKCNLLHWKNMLST